MKENGRTIRCMGKESSLGQMVGDSKERTIMIKSMGMASLHGRTADCLKESGERANKME